MNGLCEKIKPVVAAGCIGVSLINGVRFTEDGVELISEMISKVPPCSTCTTPESVRWYVSN